MDRPKDFLPAWEEQAERRIGVLEAKMDKVLDPERGIYPLMRNIESRLKSYAIAILTSVVVGVIVQVAIYYGHR